MLPVVVLVRSVLRLGRRSDFSEGWVTGSRGCDATWPSRDKRCWLALAKTTVSTATELERSNRDSNRADTLGFVPQPSVATEPTANTAEDHPIVLKIILDG